MAGENSGWRRVCSRQRSQVLQVGAQWGAGRVQLLQKQQVCKGSTPQARKWYRDLEEAPVSGVGIVEGPFVGERGSLQTHPEEDTSVVSIFLRGLALQASWLQWALPWTHSAEVLALAVARNGEGASSPVLSRACVSIRLMCPWALLPWQQWAGPPYPLRPCPPRPPRLSHISDLSAQNDSGSDSCAAA